MERRRLLKLGASIAGGMAASRISQARQWAVPVIDTHIHLFDPTRPGGVPWPEKTDAAIYKTTLPDRYERIAGPLGVVGAIVVEASPLASDNDWVLNVAAKYPIIVGTVGDLIPGSASYGKDLDRLHGNPLFLGIRCGNIWDRNLAADILRPAFLPGLKMLAERGLVLDSANPDGKLIEAIASVANHLPELRIVIDHLPTLRDPSEPLLRQLAQNKNIFVKLSEAEAARSEQGGGVGFYKEVLDRLWDIFGEDQVLYASDWPNSDHHTTYLKTITIVRDYVATKSHTAQEKFFWKNSVAAYRWRRRDSAQPVTSG